MKYERFILPAFILALLAFLFTIALVCLWIFGSIQLSIISLDTFVGVIVALLAIIVTIVLGWQIYNAIDVKQKVGTIEQVKAELQNQTHRMKQMYCNACHSHGYVAAEQAAARLDYIDAFRWLISSLHFSILMDEPINVIPTLNDMERFASMIAPNSKLDKDLFNEMKAEHNVIIHSKSFNLIKDRYNKAYSMFVSKVHAAE